MTLKEEILENISKPKKYVGIETARKLTMARLSDFDLALSKVKENEKLNYSSEHAKVYL
jgi:hypothetical protein